jgi:hypothetical protein
MTLFMAIDRVQGYAGSIKISNSEAVDSTEAWLKLYMIVSVALTLALALALTLASL